MARRRGSKSGKAKPSSTPTESGSGAKAAKPAKVGEARASKEPAAQPSPPKAGKRAPKLPDGGKTKSKSKAKSKTETRGMGKAAAPAARQQAIPPAVANRMARRTAIATGTPTVMGMGVFVVSYLLVSRSILDVPTGVTLLASGGCFLLGLLGLSYGVLSSSWEDGSGSLLGFEQIPLNISRMRDSIRAMRRGGSSQGSSGGPQG